MLFNRRMRLGGPAGIAAVAKLAPDYADRAVPLIRFAA